MGRYRYLLGLVGGGALITLVTGLYSSNPAGFVGSLPYGFPLVWLRRLVIAPQYNPWRVDLAGLVVDLVVWILVIEILYATGRMLGPKTARPKRSRR